MRFEVKKLHESSPVQGNKYKEPTCRELIGYMPLEKRVAAILAAGLNTAASKDMRYYDDDVGLESVPPFPRHMAADLAEVYEQAAIYRERRMAIEQSIREKRMREIMERKQAVESEKTQ